MPDSLTGKDRERAESQANALMTHYLEHPVPASMMCDWIADAILEAQAYEANRLGYDKRAIDLRAQKSTTQGKEKVK